MRKFASEVWDGKLIIFSAASLAFVSWSHFVVGMIVCLAGSVVAASAYGLMKQALLREGE